MLNLVVRKVIARLQKFKNEWRYRSISPYAPLVFYRYNYTRNFIDYKE